MNIAIFGGTFNPIHYGHVFAAEYIKDEMNMDKILFIPSGIPPHKKEFANKKHRGKMLELAIDGNENFIIDYYEIEQKGYSYTYNTINYLREKYKKNRFFYIIGQDAFLLLDTWYRYEDLFEVLDFIVITRAKDIKKQIEKKYLKYALNISFVDSPSIEISSTDIRQRIREGKSIRYYVNKKVEEYIKENNLYI